MVPDAPAPTLTVVIAPVDQWPWADVVGTINVQERWWSRLVAGRPAVEAAIDGPARHAAAALADALVALGASPEPAGDAPRIVDLIAARTRLLIATLGGRRTRVRPEPVGLAAVLAATNAVIASMREAGRTAVAVDPPSDRAGRVVRVASSGGGVPKPERPEVVVGWDGVSGDAQADRDNHGRPWQALCLWSAEVVEALAAEGHPIGPGACGENVLVEGIEWAEVRPGVRLHLGPDVVAEVSGETSPCHQIAAAFVGGRFDRIDHARHPGWARAYAWVEHPGVVRPGDAVRLG